MTTRDHQGERAKEIGGRIALARKEADGMTQRELADLLGVTERSVAAYEAGDVIPYRFMRQLEQLLNRPQAWLLYGDTAAGGDEALRKVLEGQEEILRVMRQILERLA